MFPESRFLSKHRLRLSVIARTSRSREEKFRHPNRPVVARVKALPRTRYLQEDRWRGGWKGLDTDGGGKRGRNLGGRGRKRRGGRKKGKREAETGERHGDRGRAREGGREERSFISAKFSRRIMARIQCTDANSRSCAECGAPFDYLDCTWPREFVSKETGGERAKRGAEEVETEERRTTPSANRVCTMDRSSIRGQAHYNLYDWSFGRPRVLTRMPTCKGRIIVRYANPSPNGSICARRSVITSRDAREREKKAARYGPASKQCRCQFCQRYG